MSRQHESGIAFLLRASKTLLATANTLDECGLTADAHTLRTIAREHTRWVVLCFRGTDMRTPPTTKA
jgi:hypothetical protein